jgi:hypothetical protein
MNDCVYGRIGWGVNHPDDNDLSVNHLDVDRPNMNANCLNVDRLNENGCENVADPDICRKKIDEWLGMGEGLTGAVKSEDFFLSASQYGTHHFSGPK